MTEPAPKRRRRWYQFSLRSLMLFILVCAIPSAWVGPKLEATRCEQVVVTEIESLGATVLYPETKGPNWITRHFRRVMAVGFEGTQDIDAGLVHLKGLTNLFWLELADTKVTDTGLVHLKGMTNLVWLSLCDTQVTDAGLVYLEELTNLERLSLCDTQVTDKGVEKLQQALPNCEISHKPPRRFPDSTDGW